MTFSFRLLIAAGFLAGGVLIPAGAKKPAYDDWYRNISEPDSGVVFFQPSKDASQSETIVLKSRERFEYCQETKKGNKCHVLKSGDLIEKRVRFQLYPPPGVYPWEYNKFKIVLKGRELYAKPLECSHEWAISKTEAGDIVLFYAKAVKKIKMDPDPDGIAFEKAFLDGGELILEFSDKWSAHYTGRTKFRISLYKPRFLFFKDKKIGEWIFEEFPSPFYRLRLEEKETGEMEGGKYYIKWFFKRAGDNVSNPVFIGREKAGFKI